MSVESSYILEQDLTCLMLCVKIEDYALLQSKPDLTIEGTVLSIFEFT